MLNLIQYNNFAFTEAPPTKQESLANVKINP